SGTRTRPDSIPRGCCAKIAKPAGQSPFSVRTADRGSKLPAQACHLSRVGFFEGGVRAFLGSTAAHPRPLAAVRGVLAGPRRRGTATVRGSGGACPFRGCRGAAAPSGAPRPAGTRLPGGAAGAPRALRAAWRLGGG